MRKLVRRLATNEPTFLILVGLVLGLDAAGMEFTRMPTVSAAWGCSPTARTRSPYLVLNSATCTTTTTTYIR